MRYIKALAAAVLCSSLFFSTGCTAGEDFQKGFNEGKRNLCKENGKRLKKVENTRDGGQRQTCRDGTVYVK